MKNSRKFILTSLCGLAAIGIYACGSTGQQGEQGAAGAKGDKGDSCTIVTNKDGTATIKCTDGSSFDIINGKDGQPGDAGSDGHDGQPGDAGSDGKNGQDGKSCYLTENADGSAAVVCPYDGSSYIVRGNTDNYANYCKDGFWGKNCENECNCQNDGICNDGVTGDGSCTCAEGWDGQNCDECAGGYTGLQCVRITCNTDNGLLNEENGKCSTCNYGWTGDNCDICQANWDNSEEGKCARCDSNHYGVSCGNTFELMKDTVNDVSYKTVQIGNQIWMAENLKATKDINGNDVTCEANTDEDADFVKKYGCLYTWEDAKKVCPAGWKLPEDTEFDELLTYVDNNKSSSSTSFLSLIANSAAWKDYSNQGLDEFGFGGLPAGYYSGIYGNFGFSGYWWSATEDSSLAYDLSLGSGRANVGSNNKTNGFSVRCLKDSH